MTDTDITALIGRLRSTAWDKDNFPRMKQEKWFPIGMAQEAADALEALQTSVERAEAAAEDAVVAYNEVEDRAEKAEADHARPLNVVSSAPQPTTEGFFAMGDPEKTDFATELTNMIGRVIEEGADVEEVKAVLTEALEELEAQGGEEEPPEGENA